MPTWLTQLLHDLGQHTGIFAGSIALIFIAVLYHRKELDGLFPWLGAAASSRNTPGGPLEPSAKNLGYLFAIAILCWGFAKITLAVCRWIDRGNDPTYIHLIYLGVIAALVGVTKIFAMKYGSLSAGDKEDTK